MNLNLFTPPTPIPQHMFWRPSIFLGGSIEMNRAVNWQSALLKSLADFELPDVEITVANPRRHDYDADQKQEMTNPYFVGQLDWEAEYQERCNILIYNFEAGTNSIITMHELGQAVERNVVRRTRYSSYPRDPQKILVRCPKDYIRSGNVYHTCYRYQIPVMQEWPEFINVLMHTIEGEFE